ncbi:MAG: sigma-54 dependent transcriptional regulator [Acidobacteriota bacterium]|nr:sigma-54 dependent transcriptional regulator [Acidobacteriota bacterium]
MPTTKILTLSSATTYELDAMLREARDTFTQLGIEFHQKIIDTRRSCLDRELLKLLEQLRPNILLLSIKPSPCKRVKELIRQLKTTTQLPLIVITESGTPDQIFALLNLGVDDYLIPPLGIPHILPRIWRLVAHSQVAGDAPFRLLEKAGLKQLIGESTNFLTEIKKIPRIARCDASVLITGETGTGKELFARSIHYLSLRSGKPFIAINCGAIPTELVENELFGHERGAFTNAFARQEGLISEADGGTLFLDEIDSLPLIAQVKLLRFLQEKEYRPIGSGKTARADIRIIAATNTNCEESVLAGRVRQDLYYRLNVIPLVLPPLRERRTDIPLLTRHFLGKYSYEFGKVVDASPAAMERLRLYDWPGNVRELANVIERAVVLSDKAILSEEDFALPRQKAAAKGGSSFQQIKAQIITQFEREYIQEMLQTYQGNITKAAQASKKNRRAFWQLIRKHRIDVQSFKQNLNSLMTN